MESQVREQDGIPPSELDLGSGSHPPTPEETLQVLLRMFELEGSVQLKLRLALTVLNRHFGRNEPVD